ncbi:MAG: shikimate dehydrogenase [Candidatus Neptunochlamydia sp.]|nr:shikimate dehydrogenase [Candidatus Neptunochlamydia sp.]
MNYKRGMLVVTIQGNFEEAKKGIQAASNLGDALEFRLDLMKGARLSHLSKLAAYSKLPIIFTLRKNSQGGRFKGSEAEREDKLLEFLTLKPEYVDLEYDSNFFDKIDPEIQVISSYHNFEKTPENLEEVLKKMKETPAAIYKLATMAYSSLDAFKMLLLVKKNKDVAGMCMGATGEITRILAPIVDSPLTYTFLEKETMPGQVSISELVDIYHYPTLNQSTEIYGLIGDPVDKSIGHLCYNLIFRKVEKNGVYVKILLKPFEVPEFFTLTKELPLVGLSVTMPLKEIVAPHLSGMDPQAKKIGAINTLVRRKGGWFGTNTDGKGALDALEKKGKVVRKTLLIIGAGGAAKAISTEASKRGARVIITNRTLGKAKTLADQIQGEFISINEIDQCPYDIIVNTTAVGMSPKIGEIPISSEFIRENSLGFDVIMHSRKTKFLNTIQNKGGKIVCGYEMYAQQALGQLKAWSIQRLSSEEALTLIESFTLI